MSSIRRTATLVATLALILPAFIRPARAGDDPRDPAQLTLKTDRVVVFKDGHALFVRHGRATADAAGQVFTSEVPDAAVLGTFWAFSKDQRVLGMRAERTHHTRIESKPAACISMAELLRANRGKRVTLALSDKREVAGVIAEVLERGAEQPPLLPANPERRRERLILGGGLVKLTDTSQGELVLPVTWIQTISGKGIETMTEREFEIASEQKRLTLEMGRENAGKPVEVTIMYFASGLRWIPTYRISGELVDRAEMALQAEILNESEDLDGVAVDLVVGVPHFKFKDVVSPLALEAKLRNALRQAAPQLMSQVAMSSNSFFRSRSGETVRPADPALPMDMAPELSAGESQDLFVYSVPRMSLKKGARATVPLWQSEAPLSHLYTFDMHLGRQVQGGSPYVRVASRTDGGTPLEVATYKVWHQLELTNRSKVPWTTGAALTLRGLLPLGQDLLGYTPVGAKSLIPLTQAVGVRPGFKEEETDREENALRYFRTSYTLIHKRATFTIQNFRSEKTTMRVRLSLGGRVTSASHDGTVVVNDYRPEDWARHSSDARVNNHSDIEWNVEIEAGKTLVFTCDYEFYVR